jgi:hypothetical protein
MRPAEGLAVPGFGLIAVCVLVGCQVPNPPVTTVWQKLGVSQAAVGMRDALQNRGGDRPQREWKPPLKRIADPENLDSDNPAIAAAAKFKQQEDQKDQKIKAIKYLAQIGCGCYDKDGDVEAAFLAALDDCTPEVRIAAAEGLAAAAGTNCCRYDGCAASCCTEKVVKRLHEMAFEVDDDGCPKEPSPAVRRAAAQAANACSAVRLPKPDEPLPTPQPEPVEGTEEVRSRSRLLDNGFGVWSPVVTGQSLARGPHQPRGPDVVAVAAVDNPEEMLIGWVAQRLTPDRLRVQLDAIYAIQVGESVVLAAGQGAILTARVIGVNGYFVDIESTQLKQFDAKPDAQIRIGVVNNH